MAFTAVSTVLFIALVAAGCGSSDSSLTKAEFIKQADTICRRAEKKKGNAFGEFVLKKHLGPGHPMTLKDKEELASDILLPPIKVEVEEVADLSAPKGEEAKVSAIVGGAEDVVAELEKNPFLFASKDDPWTEVAKLAREYNFQQCFRYY